MKNKFFLPIILLLILFTVVLECNLGLFSEIPPKLGLLFSSSPTAAPKCRIEAYQELAPVEEKITRILGSGEEIIHSYNPQMNMTSLSAVTSVKIQIKEMTVSACVEPAKQVLTKCLDHLHNAFSSSLVNDINNAKSSFLEAKNTYEKYKDMVGQKDE